MPSHDHSAREAALFVFVPFCRIKCTYCDFNAYANMARLMAPYADAVTREILTWAERQERAGDKPRAKSIFFGGGTPSLVPVEQIEQMLRACQESFSVGPGIEITLEANPGTVDERKLRTLRSLGVNRLSLGVQSFDDAVLRRLNRGHTVADARKTVEWARRAGFDNINLDMIYGLPLQTMRDWMKSLEQALALAPEHLSLYGLTIEEGTGLAFQIERGKYPRPDDDLAAEMYTAAEERLAAARYDHYEISNWARRDGGEVVDEEMEQHDWRFHLPALASQHNLTYWRNEPYLGFGAGAHSCFGGRRYWNVLRPAEYIQRIREGRNAVDGQEVISGELEMAETMILGMRTSAGVEFDVFMRRHGLDARQHFGHVLKETVDLGLVEMTDRAVHLTVRGRLLSNQVFWRFLPD